MKSGFTLIELVLAIFFSGVLLSLLFTSFFQMNRSSLLAEDLIDMDSRQQTVIHQIQKDITGAFVPVQAKRPEEKKEERKDDAAKKEEAVEKKKKEQEIKLLNDVFKSSNKGDQLSELTFITNNPMRVYPYAENAEVVSKIVRVVYRLERDAEKKESYRLMRQEGTQLDLAVYKKNATKPIRAYEVIDNIKSLTVEFKVPQKNEQETKDKKDDKNKEVQKEPVIFESKKEWHSDEIRKAKKKQSQLPQFVTLSLSLWDNQQEHEKIITVHYAIPAFGQDLIETKTKASVKDKEVKNEPNKREVPKAGQQQRVLPDVRELRASIQDYMNTVRGKKR